MGPHSSRPCPAMHKNIPPNGPLYTKFQVIPLYSHKHEGNRAKSECIGSHFNEISTSLSRLLHLYKTDQYSTCSSANTTMTLTL